MVLGVRVGEGRRGGICLDAAFLNLNFGNVEVPFVLHVKISGILAIF